jgi:aminoglycoside phosphotransferase (APT) family kinase protein
MVPSAAVLGQYADPVCLVDWERIPSGFSGAEVWKGSLDRVPTYALKCWPSTTSMERLADIHQAQRALASFPFVPKLVTTRLHLTGWSFGGRCWDLSTWMPGDVEDGEFTVPRRRAAVNAIVSIHRVWAAQSLTIDICPAIVRRLNLIGDYHEWSNAQTSVIRDPQLAAVTDRLSTPLRDAERELRGWSHLRVPVHRCFTDLHRDHLLFTGDEVTGIIDYGAVKPDNPAADLARLFGDHEATLARAIGEYGGPTIPAGLAEVLASTAAECNLAAWTLRLLRDGDAAPPDAAVRRRISNWVDRLP